MAVIRLIQGQPRHYRMDGPDKLHITLDLPDAAPRFHAARGLLTALRPDTSASAALLQERRNPRAFAPSPARAGGGAGGLGHGVSGATERPTQVWWGECGT